MFRDRCHESTYGLNRPAFIASGTTTSGGGVRTTIDGRFPLVIHAVAAPPPHFCSRTRYDHVRGNGFVLRWMPLGSNFREGRSKGVAGRDFVPSAVWAASPCIRSLVY